MFSPSALMPEPAAVSQKHGRVLFAFDVALEETAHRRAVEMVREQTVPAFQQRGTDSLLMPMLCTPGMAVSAS